MSSRNRLRLNRRELVLGSAASLGALALPRSVQSALASSERRFLFVYVYGGWDVSYGLRYLGDHPVCDADPDGVEAEEGGVPFCDAEARPSVRAFFERWGSRAALLHGLEVPSVTHESCAHLLFAGTSATRDDVPTLLAAHADPDTLLPYALLSGPNYFVDYGSIVARLGTGGLSELLSGDVMGLSDIPVAAPAADADALIDAVVRRRASALAGTAGPGRPGVFLPRYAAVLDQLAVLEQSSDALELGGFSFDEALASALSVLEHGVSRVATVMNDPRDIPWDTHAQNANQATLFERLFGSLLTMMEDLSTRSGPGGGALLDEVTVVVMSEMGRYPLLNSDAGKHHWPYTSAMLVGAGVEGGQSLGDYGDAMEGLPIDLSTGERDDRGVVPTAAHLGATLLSLGDVDPGAYFATADPITALIRA